MGIDSGRLLLLAGCADSERKKGRANLLRYEPRGGSYYIYIYISLFIYILCPLFPQNLARCRGRSHSAKRERPKGRSFGASGSRPDRH